MPCKFTVPIIDYVRHFPESRITKLIRSLVSFLTLLQESNGYLPEIVVTYNNSLQASFFKDWGCYSVPIYQDTSGH